MIDDVSFEMHDVVVKRIIPFPNKFDHHKTSIVIGIKHFDVERFRSHKVPVRIDIVAINGIGIQIEVVAFSIVWRVLVFRYIVVFEPAVVRFNGMHRSRTT